MYWMRLPFYPGFRTFIHFWFEGDMNGETQQTNGIYVFWVHSLVNEAYWIRLDQVALTTDAETL